MSLTNEDTPSQEASSEETESESDDPADELSGPGDEEFVVSDDAEDGLPSERAFSDDLHHMTHQKVKADRKWGNVQITDERIEEMLGIAEESSYSYKDFYVETLNEWQDGNFDNAVEVHNTIWNSKNGTVGKAYGLMTEREEFEYVQEQFE